MSRRVITPQSPVCQRIVQALTHHGPLGYDDLAEKACCARTTLDSGGYIRMMRKWGLIHIGGWRRNLWSGGPFSPLFAAGPGADAPKPPRLTNGQKSARWRNVLREMYGPAIARKIFRATTHGGADKVVIDGKTIYQRKRRGTDHADQQTPA